jgi:hypothetical protein
MQSVQKTSEQQKATHRTTILILFPFSINNLCTFNRTYSSCSLRTSICLLVGATPQKLKEVHESSLGRTFLKKEPACTDDPVNQ